MLISLMLLLATATAPTSSPERVVRQLYKEVVARKPLGIPTGADRAAIAPLLSTRLTRLLADGAACEADYFRQHPANDQEKPEFYWLEFGLFSGGTEMAAPAEVSVSKSEPRRNGSFRVPVLFTYRDTFETYGRTPDPRNTFQWRGVVTVVKEKGRYLIDEISLREPREGAGSIRLSEAFTGCREGKWIGNEE
jgi:hypothetical protein